MQNRILSVFLWVLLFAYLGFLFAYYLPRYYQAHPLQWNTTYDQYWGAKIPKKTHQLFKRLNELYHEYNCQNKAFLSLESLPIGYYMFNRMPPFHTGWISETGLVPVQKVTTGENMIDYLSSGKGWCVIWHHQQKPYTALEKALKRTLILPYIKRNSLTAIDVGSFKLTPSSKVWFYAN